MSIENEIKSAGEKYGSFKARATNTQTLNSWVRVECKRADFPELASLFDSFKQIPDYKNRLKNLIAWEMSKYENGE